MNTKRIGDYGENQAAKFLIKNGYRIIERNFFTKFCEIDIIAYDGECLCIVEVKTRRRSDYGMPCESVDYRKQKKLIEGALYYTTFKKINAPIRFDVVEIYINSGYFPKAEKINIIKNAFYA